MPWKGARHNMKLSQSATEYLRLLSQMFQARLDGIDETEILDKMDVAWNKLTEEELTAMRMISKALGPIMRES